MAAKPNSTVPSQPFYYSYPMPPHLYPGFNSTIHTHPQTVPLAHQNHPVPVQSVSHTAYDANLPPTGSKNTQKVYRGHTAPQLHTLCACAVEINFYAAPKGQKKAYRDSLRQAANRLGVLGSVAVLKDRLKDLLTWHLDPEACPEQLKQVMEASNIKDSFGALLDQLAESKEKCELESDEKREAIIKKAEQDKLGGEAIRQALLTTLRTRSSDVRSTPAPLDPQDDSSSAVLSPEKERSASPLLDDGDYSVTPSTPVLVKKEPIEMTIQDRQLSLGDDGNETEPDVIDLTSSPYTPPLHHLRYRCFGLGPEPTESSIGGDATSSTLTTQNASEESFDTHVTAGSPPTDVRTPFKNLAGKENLELDDSILTMKRKRSDVDSATSAKSKKQKKSESTPMSRKTSRLTLNRSVKSVGSGTLWC
ncbi:hypothetical protein K435DRAFT_844042 [Dendrothele bispora CBS 962.96]|uniref:Uncharacterized protein n=1 Tax=Dendrothele bispora (strain CBS 962.96) TaxID=1314807 RepID=A0A4S8L4K8_DENBC|nr:hypothetical protein K435DRAFT_844042 [Dendrothele bispora CBS 962.96]